MKEREQITLAGAPLRGAMYTGTYLQNQTRASRWRAIAYLRASAIAYLRAHLNSKCVPPVLMHRAITCDSFKVLAQKVFDCVTIKKKKTTQNPTFWPPGTPRHAPGAKVSHHCILLFITFDLICYMTMLVQNGFWTIPPPPLPSWPYPPGITSNFRMCSSSPHP